MEAAVEQEKILNGINLDRLLKTIDLIKENLTRYPL